MFDNLTSYTNCDATLDLSKLNTSKMTNLQCMFQNYTDYEYSVISVGDLSNWNVSNVTNMAGLFNLQLKLEFIGNLNKWDVSNVFNMLLLFNSCYSLTNVGDLSSWNTSNVSNMAGMFYGCYELTSVGDLSNWNVSNSSNIQRMFCYCYELTSVGNISSWDVSNINNMWYIFKHCLSLNQTLDVSSWDLSNVTTISMMFDTCSKLRLTGFKNWDVSKVKDMQGLFRKCISIDPDEFDFSSWDTSNVTNMWNVFSNRESREGYINRANKLHVCNEGTITRIKHFPMVPSGCNGTANLICRYDWDLTTIEASNTISDNIAFAESPLTRDSALVMLNALDVNNPKTIKFSDYTYNLLSEDDIKIGTDKGWSVVKAEPIGKFKFKGSSIVESNTYGLKLKANDDFTYTDLTVVFDDGVIATGKLENLGSYTFPVENNKVKNINNNTTTVDNNIVNMWMYTIEYNGKVYRFNNDI